MGRAVKLRTLQIFFSTGIKPGELVVVYDFLSDLFDEIPASGKVLTCLWDQLPSFAGEPFHHSELAFSHEKCQTRPHFRRWAHSGLNDQIPRVVSQSLRGYSDTHQLLELEIARSLVLRRREPDKWLPNVRDVGWHVGAFWADPAVRVYVPEIIAQDEVPLRSSR